jgi:hypothetical protein
VLCPFHLFGFSHYVLLTVASVLLALPLKTSYSVVTSGRSPSLCFVPALSPLSSLLLNSCLVFVQVWKQCVGMVDLQCFSAVDFSQQFCKVAEKCNEEVAFYQTGLTQNYVKCSGLGMGSCYSCGFFHFQANTCVCSNQIQVTHLIPKQIGSLYV